MQLRVLNPLCTTFINNLTSQKIDTKANKNFQTSKYTNVKCLLLEKATLSLNIRSLTYSANPRI